MNFDRMSRNLLSLVPLALCAATAWAQPVLVDPGASTLELVTPDPAEQAKLNALDGVVFDAFGNLFAVLEITGSNGGVVTIDVHTGAVTTLVTGISRADHIALLPDGDFLVTSEVTPASTTDRLYRITPVYDANNLPISATKTSLTTSLPIAKPEGLVVLNASGAYGSAGDLMVAEDLTAGDILRVDPNSGSTSVLASGLLRPEGLAFGDFAGALPEALTPPRRIRISSRRSPPTARRPSLAYSPR